MQTTEKLFSKEFIARVAKTHQIDLKKLPTKESIEKATIEKANEVLRTKRASTYYRLSIWSGENLLHFNFNKWDPEYQPDIEMAKKVGNQAFKIAKRMSVEPLNVLLAGDRGTGKTSLALAISDQLEKQKQSIMFVSTDELASTIGEQYELTDVKKKLVDVERAMKEVDVLLLDDFGTEGGMKNAIKPVRSDMQQFLYRVANSRIDFDSNKIKKSTIMTTNNTVEELQKMYNTKLISRLLPKNKECQIAFAGFKDVRGI
ncbi:MAG: ATP-binding protein [Liquorilactobacillus satsumensis]